MKNVNLLLSILFVFGCMSFSLANFGGGSNLENPYSPEFVVNSISTDTLPPIEERYDDFINNSNSNPFDLKDPSIVEKNVEYDPASGMYVVTEKIGDDYFRTPTYMTFQEYMDWRAKEQERQQFRALSGLSDANTSINGIVDPLEKMDLENDLINRLFGGTDVLIEPQGNIDLTFGVDFQNVENPILTTRQQRQGGFDFDMNIQLNVAGSIGEKLKLSTNYNTQATFDFDNQLKLEYDSDAFSEDDIIKKIEAGNVSLPLRSNLIQGAQSLFGLKLETQWGKLRLTGIASQQKSKRDEIEIQGGSQIQEFEVTADEYDENRHFFLSHYHKDKFESALTNLPQINSQMRITKIEVWVTNDRNETEGIREIVALTDVGEYDEITNGNAQFQTPIGARNLDIFQTDELPRNNSNDLYAAVSSTPDGRFANRAVANVTGPSFRLEQTKDFEKVRARLLSQNEYNFHPELGFISINVNLRPDQVLGVAYEYNYAGREEVYKVGELSADIPTTQDSIRENVLFVKMLKSSTQRVDLPAWDLMMKNIYSIGAYQVNREDFRLDIFYEDPGGGDKRFLPSTNLKSIPLTRIFNLDNLNLQGDPQPDGVFDFIEGITINTRNGRIMFPVLEPFGSSLANQIDGPQAEKDFYTYQMLYDSTITRAREFPEFNRFVIRGSYKSSVSNEISLGAFNLPQGSVRVTAGAQVLVEGNDYEVDYNIGRVKILNDAILQSGLPIRVSFEDNTLFGFQTKTLVGLRADYEVSENFNIGGTFLNLFERPFTQKVNIGDDPINNKIYGLDVNYSRESPFITRLVDRLPLVETKAESSISVMAELAALRPGHASAINQVTEDGERDKSGSVYIDDFEGSASNFDLRTPYTEWVPASVPQNDAKNSNPDFPEAALIDDRLSGVNRAALAWYRIDPSVRTDFDNNIDNPAPYSTAIRQEEVFRNRQITPQDNPFLFTFDLCYNPKERGPYNFDVPNGTQYSEGVTVSGDNITLNEPETRWAGIMRSLNTNNFEAANIEFLEFWVLNPFMDKKDGSAVSGAGELNINLGNISEDILRDSRLFFENGLPGGGATNANNQRPTTNTNLARIPLAPLITTAFDNDPEKRNAQDVGYDGLNDEGEKTFFSDYLNTIGINLDDPANDNFITPSTFDSSTIPAYKKYEKYNGSEGNARTISNIREIIGTNIPDSEDLNNDNTLNETESYFQYKIPIEPMPGANGQLELAPSRFITDTIRGANNRIWYRFKIPLDQFTGKVGSIQDFRSIRFIRMYLKGFDEKTIFRFARFQFVRNQWRRYRRNLAQAGITPSNPDANQTLFDVNAVNVEENSSRQPFNYVLPPGIAREQSLGAFPNALQNEQALSMEVCGLKEGDARGIFKIINMDLRVYDNIKMFVHAETQNGETVNNGTSVFMRMGSDFEKNYYEYEIPLTWSESDNLPGGSATEEYAAEVWRNENTFNFPLELFTDVKKERNTNGSLNVPYEIVDPEKPDNFVRVLGNPNIGYVKNIMIGIRNRIDNGADACAEVWVNELRLNGFDERGGVAGLARVDIQLADFGNFAASGSFSTIGWGALDQKVNQRQREQVQQYDLATDFQLGKLFPENWGLKIPFYAQYSNIDRVPEYDPYDLDITLEDKINAESDLARKKEIREQAIDRTTIRGFNFTNVRKESTKKDKKPMPWDISNFSFTYAQTETTHSDPIVEADQLDEKRGQIDYSYSRKAGYISPLKKLLKSDKKFMKHLKFITDVNINPLPNSFTFNTFGDRHKQTTKYRFAGDDPRFNTYTNKQFLWDRNYNLNWDLTKSIKIGFNATSSSVIDELPEYNDIEDRFYTDQEKKDVILENARNLGRDKRYAHDINVNYTLPFKLIPILDWVNVKAQYRGSYGWDAGALNNYNVADSVHLGNIIQNSQSRQLNADLNFEKLYDKSKFLKKINKKKRSNSRNSRSNAQRGAKNAKDKDPKKGAKKKKKEKEVSTIAKVLIRPLMLIRKARANYSENFTTIVPGYTPAPDYFGQTNNFKTPGWAFVAGQQPGDAWFNDAVADPNSPWITKSFYLNQETIRNKTTDIDGRVTLEPFTDFRIDVDANYSFTNNRSQLFKNLNDEYVGKPEGIRDQFVDFGAANRREVGSYTISYFAMQTLFQDGTDNLIELFNKFESNRTIISERLAGQGAGIHQDPEQTAYKEGYGRYQTDVLLPAFIAAYTARDANEFMDSRDADIFKTLPRPNWRLTYNGLSKIPAFKEIFKSVSLTHSYKSSLTMNQFLSDQEYYEADPVSSRNTNPQTFNYYSEFEIPNLVITEAFSPLIGLDIKLQNEMTFRADLKKARNLQMSFIDFQLSETRTSEYVVGFGYRMKDVVIPFLTGGKKKKKKRSSRSSSNNNNRGGQTGGNQNTQQGSDMNFKFDFSFRDDVTINHLLDKNIAEPTRGSRTVSISPSVDYDVNDKLNVRLFFDYNKTVPKTSAAFPITNTQGGVTVRFKLN